ncbi:hypothetical protein MNBD_DELTA01-1510 [hydrothermal vent metagenome]|uniref:Uncharacterized protein n=1 Tax=hydrothermal vent metagenome TaxID=652676 RepID=A0A3B0QNI7_9ZZZZ
MPNTIALLREIQRIDLLVDALLKEEAQYRASLAGSGEELGGMTAEVEVLEAEVLELTTQKKEKEDRVRQNKERIEKDQTRLSEIKNDKQYKAVNKEISNAEKSNRLLGMEIDALSDKLTEKENEFNEQQGRLSEKDAALGGMKEDLAGKEALWAGTREGLDAERAGIAKDIKPQIISRYERIKSRRGGIGIVNVADETCLGCYIQIPPQIYIHLLKNTSELIDCPHCHRMLYFAAEKQEGEDAAASPSEKSPEPALAVEAAEEVTPEEVAPEEVAPEEVASPVDSTPEETQAE